MSVLELKVTADTRGLTAIRAAAAELRSTAAKVKITSQKEIAELETSLNSLRATAAKTTAQANTTTAAITKSGAASKTAAGKTVALRDATRGAAGAAGSLWMAYGQLIPLMGAFAATATLIKGIGLAADFEYQTKYTSVLAEATGDYSLSLKSLRKDLMGIRNVVDAPATLAEASKELVKAGFSSVQATKEIAEMSDTAMVVQEDLGLVTKGVAAQFRAWNQEAVGAERGVGSLTEAANMMAYAALASATDFGELNQMLAYTTELAPLTGASFSEVLAALGHMTNMGIRGTKAATALRTAMLKLQNPVEGISKELEKLRVPFSAFDEMGDQKDMVTLFEDLNTSLASLNNEARVTMLQDLFGLRSMKGGVAIAQAMAKAVDEGKFSFRGLAEAIAGVGESMDFISKLKEEMSDTTKVQWDLLKADVIRDLTASFEDSNGALRSLLTTARELIADGSFRSFIDLMAGGAEKGLQLVDVLGKVGDKLQWVQDHHPAFMAKWGVKKAWTGLGKLKDFATQVYQDIQDPPELKGGGVESGIKSAQQEANTSLKNDSWIMQALKLGPVGDYLTAAFRRARGDYDALEERARNAARRSEEEAAFLDSDSSDYFDIPEPTVTKAAKKKKLGGDDRPDPNADKLAEWRAQNELDVQRKKLEQYEAFQNEYDSRSLRLLDAKLKAQLISEREYTDQVRTIKEDELSRQIVDAETLIEIQRKKYEKAKAFAADNQEEISAQKAEARELDKLNTELDRLARLKSELATLPELFSAEDVAKVVKYKDAVRGLIQEAEDMNRKAEQLAELAGMDAITSRYKQAVDNIISERDRELQKLREQLIEEGDMRYTLVEDAYQRQLDAARRYYEAEKALRDDWQAGMINGLKEYAETAGNTYNGVKGVVTSALSTMEDGLVKFVTTGKMEWRDMIDSMIKDIIRLMIQKAIAGLISSAFTPGASAATSGTNSFSASNTASQTNYFQYADGGVLSGAGGLSKHSGTVLKKPTAFMFASGMGIAGEDGDEGIFPLKRGKDGKLGVAAEISGTGKAPKVDVNVHNYGEEKQVETRSSFSEMRGWVVDIILKDVQQNGPVKQALQGGGI